MPVYRIPDALVFPNPALADDNGLLGVGGDLSRARLLLAYKSGIFPWYSNDEPILWWSPDPRMVLFTEEFRVQRSLAKRVRQRPYRITLDTAFPQVLRACASTFRPGQGGTWITPAVEAAYNDLFDAGYGHSVEAWDGETLVGGLYGVGIGRMFSGESMFAHAPDASKIAFTHLVRQLQRWNLPLVDCQIHTEHLDRFGAKEIERQTYLAAIQPLVNAPVAPGRWQFDADFVCDG